MLKTWELSAESERVGDFSVIQDVDYIFGKIFMPNLECEGSSNYEREII
jgi:hypothetical protein